MTARTWRRETQSVGKPAGMVGAMPRDEILGGRCYTALGGTPTFSVLSTVLQAVSYIVVSTRLLGHVTEWSSG